MLCETIHQKNAYGILKDKRLQSPTHTLFEVFVECKGFSRYTSYIHNSSATAVQSTHAYLSRLKANLTSQMPACSMPNRK